MPPTAKPLTRAHLSILAALHEAGGAGTLDVYGRLFGGLPSRPLPGDPNAWLVLVAHGMVAGERGQIIVTEAGRARTAEILAGRVREAV